MIEIDDRELRALQQHLATAPSRIERRTAGRTTQAIRELLRVARQVAHQRSGALVAGLAIVGPFQVGAGTLEGQIRSSVPYAEDEAARGGEHDFPARTLDEGESVLDRLARDIEQIYIQETGAS